MLWFCHGAARCRNIAEYLIVSPNNNATLHNFPIVALTPIDHCFLFKLVYVAHNLQCDVTTEYDAVGSFLRLFRSVVLLRVQHLLVDLSHKLYAYSEY